MLQLINIIFIYKFEIASWRLNQQNIDALKKFQEDNFFDDVTTRDYSN